MKKLIFLFFAFVLFSFYACQQKDECEDLDCINEAGPLYIELIDEETDINVFTAGILNDSSQLVIVNSDFESQKYSLISANNTLELKNITKVIGAETYQIIIRNDYIITFQIDMQTKLVGDCCETYYVNNFKLSSLPYEFNEETIYAKIYVDLD